MSIRRVMLFAVAISFYFVFIICHNVVHLIDRIHLSKSVESDVSLPQKQSLGRLCVLLDKNADEVVVSALPLVAKGGFL
jgi:hypothetical protein